MKTEKPYLSVTQLDMLSKCGEQYRRRYLEGEIIPPGIALVVGSATDKAVSSDLQHKVDTGELLEAEAVSEIARDTVVVTVDHSGILLTEEELSLGLKAVKGQAVDKAVRLALLHHRGLAPHLEPTHVQRWWRIELDGYPRDLVGIIDVQEGARAVRDTKTASKSPAADAAHSSDQLTMYAMACQVLDGAIPERLTLDHLVDTKEPKLVTLETTRQVEDFLPILSRVETALNAIEKGVFVPARQQDWWCSTKWCGYADTCRYFRASSRIAA